MYPCFSEKKREMRWKASVDVMYPVFSKEKRKSLEHSVPHLLFLKGKRRVLDGHEVAIYYAFW
jgi:hypothetical protein